MFDEYSDTNFAPILPMKFKAYNVFVWNFYVQNFQIFRRGQRSILQVKSINDISSLRGREFIHFLK